MNAKAEMLIRRPVAEVFQAFVDPAITTKFWFTKSSGRLEAGKQIHWEWDVHNASTDVYVKELDPNKRILIEWGEPDDRNIVEWIFTSRPDNTTFVSITNSGFHGNREEIVEKFVGSTEGFTIVLAALKALLEHNIELNLVADRFLH